MAMWWEVTVSGGRIRVKIFSKGYQWIEIMPEISAGITSHSILHSLLFNTWKPHLWLSLTQSFIQCLGCGGHQFFGWLAYLALIFRVAPTPSGTPLPFTGLKEIPGSPWGTPSWKSLWLRADWILWTTGALFNTWSAFFFFPGLCQNISTTILHSGEKQ